jgi:mevalonate kinase
MTIEIEIPSKTFLVGEYAVLNGGPALIVNTQAAFHVRIHRGQGLAAGIHRQSPAGQFLRENQALFSRYDLEFLDPHQGRGGLGASSAQFLAAWVFREMSLTDSIKSLHGQQWPLPAFRDFKNTLAKHQQEGSGADLLAQAVGAVAVLRMQPLQSQRRRWPFAEEGFAIFRTGTKVNTHDHLKDMQHNTSVALTSSNLVAISNQAVQSFEAADWSGFVQDLRAFRQAQTQLGLVADSTLQILKKLDDQPGVEFAKGSGSLGADTVVVLYKLANKTDVLANIGLEPIATEADLAEGLNVRVFPSAEMTL